MWIRFGITVGCMLDQTHPLIGTPCKNPACPGKIIVSAFRHRLSLMCQQCGTVYTTKGKIRMTGMDWTPAVKDCTPGYAEFRGLN